ncbi:MAG: c-type cytochrome, methanol metabolism-related [Alphaproteobacteria bacterium]
MIRSNAIRGLLLCCAVLVAASQSAVSSVEKTEDDGKFSTKDGDPTYNITKDGGVDWYTYSGFRRYHSDCHVCHGPEGLGSSYAPALVDSLKKLSYEDFATVVASGRQKVNAAQTSVMPAFGTNRNVMCYLDDIYAYLKARSDGALGRGRPRKHAPQPKSAKNYENECMGQ